jgi:hypothetical protein
MSEQPTTTDGELIRWDLADRMRKSLRVSGVTAGQMADYLDVGGNTVSTWINGHIEPGYAVLRLWSLRTGVPLRWLHHGDMEPCALETVRISAGQRTPSMPATKMQRLQTYECA